LKLAGHRCEFRPLEHENLKDGGIPGERCTATRHLEVHHLHYDTLGCEVDVDLEVLCHKHHLVRTIQDLQCEACCDQLVFWESDALAMVEHAYESFDPSPHPMTLDDVLEWGGSGRLCAYCDDMLSKDD
jgi:hypothetical protein